MITNKEYLETLGEEERTNAIDSLYFCTDLYIKHNDKKYKKEEPTIFEINKWLDAPYDPYSRFWRRQMEMCAKM